MTRSWRAHCGHALAVHRDVAEVMAAWPAPPALKWWREAEVPPGAGRIPPQNARQDRYRRATQLDRRTR
jgi:hypothetical protein